MAKLTITDAGYFLEALQQAKEISEKTLADLLDDVKYLGGDPKDFSTEVELYPEVGFGGPHSFGFVQRHLQDDGTWKRGVNGGLIFHSSCKEWSVHT